MFKSTNAHVHHSIFMTAVLTWLPTCRPSNFSARCCDIKWSKCCLLGFDTFPDILEQPEVLGHQQSTCRKDPAIQQIADTSFLEHFHFATPCLFVCLYSPPKLIDGSGPNLAWISPGTMGMSSTYFLGVNIWEKLFFGNFPLLLWKKLEMNKKCVCLFVCLITSQCQEIYHTIIRKR